MKEKFQSTLVACAAIVAFAGGAGALVNGASSIIDLKVDSILVSKETAKLAAEKAADDAGMASTIVKGARKLLN
jgi:hypothetical protein